MNTSSDNLDEGLIDNYKKLRKTGKEIENMTEPLRKQASKSIGNAVKNLTKGNKKDTNVVKQSDVSKKAAEFTKDYNKTKNITVPKAKKTPITPAMKEKAFKQSFGKPTGADPTTGKGTYKPPKNITNRNLYVDKAGKPTPKGIDKYITNRNTKGKFKGADIKPDTVSKGLEKTAKDIKNPTVRKSTASQIQSKYGGRRAETSKPNGFKAFKNDPAVKATRKVSQARVDATKDITANVKSQGNTYTRNFNAKRNALYKDPWNDAPNMKVKTSTTKAQTSKLDLKPPKGEIIGGPTGKASTMKGPKSSSVYKIKFKDFSKKIASKSSTSGGKSSPVLNKWSKSAGQKALGDVIKGKDYSKAIRDRGTEIIKKGNETTSIVRANKQVVDLAKSPAKGGKLTASARGLENTSDLAKSPKIKVSSDGPPPRSAASKMTNFPKKGKVTGSSWVTRGYAKQFGALSGVAGGIDKYKQERAKGKGVLASATAGATKGSARGLGTYAGTVVGTRYGGKLGGFIGGTVGGAVGDRAYEVGKNVTKAVGKTFKSFGKSNKYTDTDAYKKLIKPKKPGQKYKSIGIGS